MRQQHFRKFLWTTLGHKRRVTTPHSAANSSGSISGAMALALKYAGPSLELVTCCYKKTDNAGAVRTLKSHSPVIEKALHSWAHLDRAE